VAARINNNFPEYTELIHKTEPVPLRTIMKQLKRDEAIIDYYISDAHEDFKKNLLIFIITRKGMDFRDILIDSLFFHNARTISEANTSFINNQNNSFGFYEYTSALWYMYQKLLQPVEELIPGNRLIIIPDGEIAWLPFEVLLASVPDQGLASYEGLDYMINRYLFSYGYSSSLVKGTGQKINTKKVFAFAPDYSGSEGGIEMLRGTKQEISNIFRWFRGKEFTGGEATKENFRNLLQTPAIFHLAMHSFADSGDTKFSYLLFSTGSDFVENAKLYNYEINLNTIISPMIVLSACNSGSGTLYNGEGLMSLARGFLIAGASSVVKTSWEVNDEVSETIITSFYKYLSKGLPKDKAMRRAKLDFIDDNPPSRKDPYYWASYEILGDNSPVVSKTPLMIVVLVLVIIAGSAGFYLIRRRIFPDRSE
jgi:CHAT domain-containing protein